VATFERWLGNTSTRLEGWASWGDYDRKQLLQEWQRLHSTAHWPSATHEPQAALCQGRRLERPLGLNGALQLAGMQFTGQQHRALEDARNTARLLPLVLPSRGADSAVGRLCILAGPF
jgi:inhibitor of KinA sporulation pathway (predicted exonuclease)